MWKYYLHFTVLLGAVIRYGYAYITPFRQRAHDYGGHIDYIKHVLDYGTIPASQSGWEMHQAPLYYFAASMWARLTSNVQDWAAAQRSIQFFDATLTVVTLILMTAIGAELFKGEKDVWKLRLYALLIAVAPAMMYIASGTNNDALHQVTSSAFLLALLKWWRRGTKNDWYSVSFATGVAFITKASSLIFLPVTLICIWFREKKMPLKDKGNLALTYLMIVALVSGWLFALRAAEENKTRLLKLGNLNVIEASRVPTNFSTFTTFRPAEVLKDPFVVVFTPGKGREYFWEYFYKTIFFTSWPFRTLTSLSSTILAVGLLAAAMMFLGIFTDLRKGNRWNVPLLSTGAFLMASLIGYRTYQQYVANQDFRFITLLGPIVVYYAIRGIGSLPSAMRPFGAGVLWLLAGLMLAFDVLVIATY